MRCWKLGIVGAGPGGLMTAYSLQRLINSPCEITIFEASQRIGGKIQTPTFADGAVRYEAGAAEFYDYSHFDEDSLKELVEELGLPIRTMGGPAVIVDHQVLSNLDDVRQHLGPASHRALVEFDRMAKDRMTTREFYHSDYPDGAHGEADRNRFDALLARVTDPRTRHYIEQLIHSDLATEPCQTSPAYGLQNYLMNDPAYMNLYGIEGGNEQLPKALAARIEAHIRFGHSVKQIGKADAGGMRIVSEAQGELREDDFDFVVIALPHNQLGQLAFDGERLSNAMHAHHAYYDYPAHYLRMTLLFERPFWRESFSDSYWMLDQFGGCCLYDESSRDPGADHGVLGWLLGGKAALEMSRLDDEELIEEALMSLPDFLTHGRNHFLEGRVHRWIGAVNAMPGGALAKTLDQRHQPEPVAHPSLFVVGDYLYDSTLNGVLDSAEYVAGWLASLMTDSFGDAV